VRARITKNTQIRDTWRQNHVAVRLKNWPFSTLLNWFQFYRLFTKTTTSVAGSN